MSEYVNGKGKVSDEMEANMKALNEAHPAEEYQKILTDDEIDERMKTLVHQKTPTAIKPWTNLDLMLRRQAIYALYCKGYSTSNITRELSSRWKCAWETVKRFVIEAMEFLAEDNKDMIKFYRDIQSARLEEMIAECKEQRKYKEAAMFMEQLSKLKGLYTEKTEVLIKDYQTTFKFGE